MIKRFSRQVSPVLATFFLLVSIAGTAFAQRESGQIVGKVTDPQGALVKGATVTVKSADTAAEVTTTTGDDGSYSVTNLKPGLYDVTVKSSGYADSTQRVQVTVGSSTTVATSIAIQAITGAVNVTIGEAGISVNTQNQEVSNVVS